MNYLIRLISNSCIENYLSFHKFITFYISYLTFFITKTCVINNLSSYITKTCLYNLSSPKTTCIIDYLSAPIT